MNTEIIEIVRQAMSVLYGQYKDKGVLAMYIWGSILTDDFNEATSDIDTIIIAEDRLPVEEEQKMMDSVRATNPRLKEFFLRFVYLSELDGGPAKAPLAKVIWPSLLLLEMPNWFYVKGKKFKNTDFGIQPPTFKEAIKVRLSRIKKEGWDRVSKIQEQAHLYFLKGLVRMIDLLQKDRGDGGARFSYTKVFDESQKTGTDLEKQVMSAIIESKNSHWGYQVFLKRVSLYQEFIDMMLERYLVE